MSGEKSSRVEQIMAIIDSEGGGGSREIGSFGAAILAYQFAREVLSQSRNEILKEGEKLVEDGGASEKPISKENGVSLAFVTGVSSDEDGALIRIKTFDKETRISAAALLDAEGKIGRSMRVRFDSDNTDPNGNSYVVCAGLGFDFSQHSIVIEDGEKQIQRIDSSSRIASGLKDDLKSVFDELSSEQVLNFEKNLLHWLLNYLKEKTTELINSKSDGSDEDRMKKTHLITTNSAHLRRLQSELFIFNNKARKFDWQLVSLSLHDEVEAVLKRAERILNPSKR